MVVSIDHINIVVDDIDLMSQFYSDVIGLTVFKKSRIYGDWLDRVTGLKNVEADVVLMGGIEGPNIELIKYLTPEGIYPDKLTIPNTKGLRHLAFQVNNIHSFVETCTQYGVRFHSKVQEVSTVKLPQGRKLLVYFEDPEGTLLEFCSYEPSCPLGSCALDSMSNG